MSDIFNEFAKIAIEKGLITEAKEVGNESNPRFDSLSNDDIKALYGIKPEGDSEEHILDQAHPESVYVAPAYDKMNGLVENLFERQDVMQWIATKPNDGKHTNERYVKANQDLTMALLNTAFMLDKTGDMELMKLADNCASRLVKTAWSWKDFMGSIGLGAGALGIGGILGGGTTLAAGLSGPVGWAVFGGVLGIAAIINNFGPRVDKGVVDNCSSAIKQLTDVIKDKDEAPGLTSEINGWIEQIQTMKSLGEEAANLPPPNSKEEIPGAKELVVKYLVQSKKLMRALPTWIGMLSGNIEAGSDKSDVEAMFGKVWGYIWTSDTKDAESSMQTLLESLSDSRIALITHYKTVKNYVLANKDEIEEAAAQEAKTQNKALSDPDKLEGEEAELFDFKPKEPVNDPNQLARAAQLKK